MIRMQTRGAIRRALLALASVFLLAAGPATAALAAAPPAAITTPHDNDDFSRLVAQAEADDPATDFKALRMAWPTSAAHKRRDFAPDLMQQLYKAAGARDEAKVAAIARKLISSDYTSLRGHQYLRQACTLQKDDVCATHEHFVEFGLLKSITAEGDGKSLATAWKVASIEEEYFMLDVLDIQPANQALLFDHDKPYDRLEGKTKDGKAAPALYFDISAFFGHELE